MSVEQPEQKTECRTVRTQLDDLFWPNVRIADNTPGTLAIVVADHNGERNNALDIRPEQTRLSSDAFRRRTGHRSLGSRGSLGSAEGPVLAGGLKKYRMLTVIAVVLQYG